MNQPGTQWLPPVQLSCHKHNDLIKGVCLYHDSCNERLLCRVCRKFHDNNHLNSYEEFDELLNGNLALDLIRGFDEMTKRIEEQSQNSVQNVEMLTAQINGLFHEIQNYLVEKLVESRDKIFEDIQAKFYSNNNIMQKIRTCREEVRKVYKMAADSGFKPLFVIENLIQTIRQAHIERQRILRDPEMHIQHTGDMVQGYLAALTSGSLFTQIQNSVGKLCEDIVESFVLRRKNDKSAQMSEAFQQEANRLYHGLAQQHQEANFGLQKAFTEPMTTENPQGSLFAETASFLNKYNPLLNLEGYGDYGQAAQAQGQPKPGLFPELSLRAPQNSVNYEAIFRQQFGEKENEDDNVEGNYPSMQVESESKKRSGQKHTPSELLAMFENANQTVKSSQGKSTTRSDENPENKSLHDLFAALNQGGGDRSPNPASRRKDLLESQASIPTSHKQIMFGGLAYLKQNLATAGQEGKIQVWDVSKKQSIRTFQAHSGEVFRLLYIPEKDFLVSSGGDGTINAWDCKKSFEKVTSYTKLGGPVYALEYLSDLDMLASGGEDGELRVWNIETLKEYPPYRSDEAKIGSVCYLKKLKMIAIGLDSGQVLVASIDGHTKKITPKFTLPAHNGYVLNMAFIEEQSLLLTGAEDGLIKVWRIYPDNGTLIRDFGEGKGGKSALMSFAVISEKDLILSNHNDKFVRAWKISTGDKIAELSDGTFGECIIGIKNKNKVITANHNEVKLWNLNF